MQILIIGLCLISGLFADYKVTQINYHVGYHNRTWITEGNSAGWKQFNTYSKVNAIICSSTAIWFIDKKTGKLVIITMPFTVEEL